ncbi:MAG: hypothetical protein RKL32_06540, partial [Gammaproteobacteria bacterium]
RFQRHVAPLDRPLVVLLEQQCPDQADDGGLVGEAVGELSVASNVAAIGCAAGRIGVKYVAPGKLLRWRRRHIV